MVPFTLYRKVATLGAQACKEKVHNESMSLSDQIATEEKYDKYFIDKSAAIGEIGGVKSMASRITSARFKEFNSSVDSASLIFAHSILDAVSFDFCRTIASEFPDSWTPFIENKQISIKDSRELSSEKINNKFITAELKKLEKESLLVKMIAYFKFANLNQSLTLLKVMCLTGINLPSLIMSVMS
ncbi:MAG: hypothetical protein AB8D52_11195 [Gammaproteobacteria bacterium]